MNGIDNDGDGAVDEDPEDYQPLRGASEGFIRLYYVEELQKLAEWTIPSLQCIEHNANDGLRTSAEGIQHSVLVKVPVALMDKSGEYRFVISAKDSHADREKGHRAKWALERNQQSPIKIVAVEWLAVAGNEALLDDNPGNGLAGTNIGRRIFPDRNAFNDPQAAQRRRVRVRVTLNRRRDNFRVKIKAFDVDDPSANAAPIDTEQVWPTNNADNRGLPQTGQFERGGDWIIVRTGVREQAGKVAEAVFLVTMQSGDNFRVVATGAGEQFILHTVTF